MPGVRPRHVPAGWQVQAVSWAGHYVLLGLAAANLTSAPAYMGRHGSLLCLVLKLLFRCPACQQHTLAARAALAAALQRSMHASVHGPPFRPPTCLLAFTVGLTTRELAPPDPRAQLPR